MGKGFFHDLGGALKSGSKSIGGVFTDTGKGIGNAVGTVYKDTKHAVGGVYSDAKGAVGYAGKHYINDVDKLTSAFSSPIVIIAVAGVAFLIFKNK